MFKHLIQAIDSMMARDPAAVSRLEVVICYPGFQAVMAYRVAHWLWHKKLRLLGRAFSQLARWLTGIEIHPGAEIGSGLFIDHGMGVVIGETSIIGKNVTLYHGVTLGGVAPSVDADSQRDQKRHPTLGDDVIVGSGAQVLGPITVAHCARIGANAVVTKDVPQGATVVGNPGKVVRVAGQRAPEEQKSRFVAYGTPTGDIPDPVARALDGLLHEVQSLRARVNELETREGDVEDRETLSADEESRSEQPSTDDGRPGHP